MPESVPPLLHYFTLNRMFSPRLRFLPLSSWPYLDTCVLDDCILKIEVIRFSKRRCLHITLQYFALLIRRLFNNAASISDCDWDKWAHLCRLQRYVDTVNCKNDIASWHYLKVIKQMSRLQRFFIWMFYYCILFYYFLFFPRHNSVEIKLAVRSIRSPVWWIPAHFLPKMQTKVLCSFKFL